MTNRAALTSPVLDRVLRSSLCSGCGACAAIAPKSVGMQLSSEGFLRPIETQDLTPEQNQKIAAVCPGNSVLQQPDGRQDHPLWGPFVGMYEGHATDTELRYRGSSGGGLSAILLHLLETNAVDNVIEVAADLDQPIQNRTILTKSKDEVLNAAGSRYAPSSPLAGLEEILDTGQTYAFVGKPCDVSALRALSRLDPRVEMRIPYMLSFFCAGVPSLAGAREILAKLEVNASEVTGFRYRGNGWPGFATATLKDGQEKQMSYADSWGGILSRHVQFRCKICPDGTGGFADVVCADAWEANENGYPIFTERDGVSLIVGRTEKGEALIQEAMRAKKIAATPFSPDALETIQPGQTQKRRFTFARLLALRCLGRATPQYKGFHLFRNALRGGLWPNFRNFLGTLRRAILGRL